ncbi:MAG: DNA polymerase ligase N-terminal domain-containing protein [Nitrososphaerota archaeon]
MAIEEYRSKRDFKRTPEPEGTVETSKKELVYVIQEHHATHLHWDLRLEHEGVLKSWAIPKEPPTAPGVRRLAVAVEDHPLEYAEFTGVIPEGEYGAGEVKIWDRGTYVPISVKEEKWVFEIRGERLKGEYALIKTSYGKGNSWIFFKVKPK